MHVVHNSLLRIENPESELIREFERIREDLDVYVAELPCDIGLTDWEAATIQFMSSLGCADMICDTLALFVETAGDDTTVVFSHKLLAEVCRLKGRIEHRRL